jgi:putative phosphoesterase
MRKIGLISDTHGYLDDAVFEHFSNCDEVWHAGDFGHSGLVDILLNGLMLKNPSVVMRGVYGNIDGKDIRTRYAENTIFKCEDVKVMMQHIGGYPGRYAPGVKQKIQENKIDLFISGHSHILKVIFDKKLQCLHMNPGAAGKQGWHKVRTLIRFCIEGKDIKNCEIIELNPH